MTDYKNIFKFMDKKKEDEGSEETDTDSEETYISKSSSGTSEELSSDESRAKSKQSEKTEYDCFERSAIIFSYALVVIFFPWSLLFCMRVVFEFERAVIFRLGKLREGGARGPGLIFVLSCIDECFIADLRTETVYVYPQELLTKDSVTIHIEAVVFFRLRDPVRGIVEVGDYRYATLLLAQTAMRNIAAEKNLQELLLETNETVQSIHEYMAKATDEWGVVVERVEIRDIRLPFELHRSMAAEAEANRMAKARIINAEGEKRAANALKIASDTISSSPGAVQMRYLQTLRFAVKDPTHVYVMPLCMEMLQFCKDLVLKH